MATSSDHTSETGSNGSPLFTSTGLPIVPRERIISIVETIGEDDMSRMIGTHNRLMRENPALASLIFDIIRSFDTRTLPEEYSLITELEALGIHYSTRATGHMWEDRTIAEVPLPRDILGNRVYRETYEAALLILVLLDAQSRQLQLRQDVLQQEEPGREIIPRSKGRRTSFGLPVVANAIAMGVRGMWLAKVAFGNGSFTPERAAWAQRVISQNPALFLTMATIQDSFDEKRVMWARRLQAENPDLFLTLAAILGMNSPLMEIIGSAAMAIYGTLDEQARVDTLLPDYVRGMPVISTWILDGYVGRIPFTDEQQAVYDRARAEMRALLTKRRNAKQPSPFEMCFMAVLDNTSPSRAALDAAADILAIFRLADRAYTPAGTGMRFHPDKLAIDKGLAQVRKNIRVSGDREGYVTSVMMRLSQVNPYATELVSAIVNRYAPDNDRAKQRILAVLMVLIDYLVVGSNPS